MKKHLIRPQEYEPHSPDVDKLVETARQRGYCTSMICDRRNDEGLTMTKFHDFLELAARNSWFSLHQQHLLTEEFVAWWLDTYGIPGHSRRASGRDEQEYWVRCAFALSGWRAGRRDVMGDVVRRSTS